MRVVATAGHVDHGKSTLVLALTGTDPDRWAEEKARGLTIDLGFAHTTLADGGEVGFVDVPGHIRFLRNMLAGVGGVDACLFVVAATEGWKPQSEEHLRILELLGHRHGLVALTKVGRLDADTRELVRIEIGDHLAGTFLENAEIVEVDAVEGEGVDDLRAALARLVAAAPAAEDRGRPRLWVDRSFAAKGAGTIVTGTLTGGALAIDDDLVIAPRPAGGLACRVRNLQSHGADLTVCPPGRRVAVNVSGPGVHHTAVTRGDALVRAGQWAPSAMVDATLDVLASLGHDVSRRGAHLAYIGSGEHPVRVRVLGPDAIAPGGHGLVRLHLPAPLPLLPGDRYVLREAGRGETVGGGEILDVAPVLPASKAKPDRRVERVVAERGAIEAADLERLTGVAVAPTFRTWVVDPEAWDDPSRLSNAELRDAILADRAAPAPAAPDLGDDPYLAALRQQPFTPPPPPADRASVRALVKQGLVVEHDQVYFAATSIEAAARAVAGELQAKPDGLTVAEIRELLGTTRKWALPLVAILDREGMTRRRGDLRIAGPRLPDP